MTDIAVLPRTNGTILKAAIDLDNLSYDQQRESLAEEMGVRVGTLDAERKKARKEKVEDEAPSLFLSSPESCVDSVDGVELLNSLVATINEYLVLPEGAAEAMALWIIHTYCHEAAQISPLLIFSSPTKQCGKTTCLTLLGSIADKPLTASNFTAPVLFRGIDKHGPTLFLDEADTFLKEDEAMRGVINSGHNRSSAYALRLVGDDHGLKKFSTWCPKAIAAIGKLPATLMDRAIVIPMQRKKKADKVRRLRGDRLHEFEPLRQQCARWKEDNIDVIKATDPDVPDYLGDRARDNWRTLLAIADVAGWTEPTLRAIRQLTPEKAEDDDIGVQLLADIRVVIGDRDRIPSADLVASLNQIEDRPWPGFYRGKGLSTAGMARMLGKYGIKPANQRIRGVSSPSRGYQTKSFVDAWSRYLPDSSVTPLQPSNDEVSSDFPAVTKGLDVTPRNGLEPPPDKGCNTVTPEKQDGGIKSVLI